MKTNSCRKVKYFALMTIALWSLSAFAKIDYSTHFSSSDYGFMSNDVHSDDIFDALPEADIGGSINWGSSCGKMNMSANLQSTLDGILGKNSLFKSPTELLTQIGPRAPMLLLCYLSPTMCNIMKHGQISAQMATQTRLDQCSLIDRYIDSRSQQADESYQACVRSNLKSKSIDDAIDDCQKSGETNYSLWGGSRQRGNNRLIGSSADWAGFSQSVEGEKSVNLLKDLVGDVAAIDGDIHIEYGSRGKPLSPRLYLGSIQKASFDKLCRDFVGRVVSEPRRSTESLVSLKEIKDLAPMSPEPVVDWQTLRSLAAMAPNQRAYACKRLSDQIALTQFTYDMNRSLDMLTTMAQNPNLPDARKRDIEAKRQALKESIEMTLALRNESNQGLSQVLSQINSQGESLRQQAFQNEVKSDESASRNQSLREVFFDCSDGTMCDEELMMR